MAQNIRTTSQVVQVDETEDEMQEELETQAIDVGSEPASERASRPRRRPLRRLFAAGGFGVWLGLLLLAAGFGLLAFTWSQTAALTDVAQQVPYLVSGGLVGLGLILGGLFTVNLTVKRRDALDRARQLEEVRDALVSLRRSIEGDDVGEVDKP